MIDDEKLPEPWVPEPDPEVAYCREIARRMLAYEIDPRNFLQRMRQRQEFQRAFAKP